jgi:hypothetical protein
LNFSLELLGSLLSPAFEILDLLLHRGDSLLLVQHFEFQLILRLLFRLLPRGGKPCTNPLFNRKLNLALGVIQLPLFPEEVGLGSLGLGKFRVSLFQDLLKLRDLLCFLIEIAGQGKLGLPGFVGCYFYAFFLKRPGNLVVDGLLRLRDRLFARPERRFPFGNIKILLGKPLLKIAPCCLDEWSCQ